MPDVVLADDSVRTLKLLSKAAACLYEHLLNEPREDDRAPLFSREEAFELTKTIMGNTVVG